MTLSSVIGKMLSGYAITLYGGVVAVMMASEAVKPIIQVAQAVSNVVPS